LARRVTCERAILGEQCVELIPFRTPRAHEFVWTLSHGAAPLSLALGRAMMQEREQSRGVWAGHVHASGQRGTDHLSELRLTRRRERSDPAQEELDVTLLLGRKRRLGRQEL